MNRLRSIWHHLWCNLWYRAHSWCGARASLHYDLGAKAVIDEVNSHRSTKEVS